MSTLIACLSTGKGTWGHVSRVIQDGKFDSVILITNDYGKENFQKLENTDLVAIKLEQGMKELRDEIYKNLKEKIKSDETEVALNLASGTGKEHMALLSALLKLGIGIRLMALTKEGIEEI
ncbi:hypothetical protein HYT57_04365 [Candidatus Woesearchaeota archaeon]|nr:hypothetical protein [Candidatus Woesearchaeota archaeon]